MAAYEANLITLGTLKATADLSAHQFQFVKLDTSNVGQIVLCATAGEVPLGVLLNKPTAGQAAVVAVGGVCKVVAGGSITVGDNVATDASGKAKTATGGETDTTAGSDSTTTALKGSYVFGRALATAVSGDYVSMLITNAGAVPTTAL